MCSEEYVETSEVLGLEVEITEELMEEKTAEKAAELLSEQTIESPVELDTEQAVGISVEPEAEQTVEISVEPDAEQTVEISVEPDAEQTVEISVKPEAEQTVDLTTEPESADEPLQENPTEENVCLPALKIISEKLSTLETIPEKLSSLGSISDKLAALETLISRRLAYDNTKEKIIDKLHAELQDYKADIYAKLTRPIFADIVVVLDDIRKTRESLDLQSQAEVDSQLEMVAESLLFLLEKYEVLPFSSEVHSKFNASKQRMVKVQTTSDPTLVGTIASSIFSGFTRDGLLITPEKISAYKLEEK